MANPSTKPHDAMQLAAMIIVAAPLPKYPIICDHGYKRLRAIDGECVSLSWFVGRPSGVKVRAEDGR